MDNLIRLQFEELLTSLRIEAANAISALDHALAVAELRLRGVLLDARLQEILAGSPEPPVETTKAP